MSTCYCFLSILVESPNSLSYTRPRQSLVEISNTRNDLTTLAGFGRDSSPQSSEGNPLIPSAMLTFSPFNLRCPTRSQDGEFHHSIQSMERIRRGLHHHLRTYSKHLPICERGIYVCIFIGDPKKYKQSDWLRRVQYILYFTCKNRWKHKMTKRYCCIVAVAAI